MFDISTIPVLDSLDGSELIVVYVNGIAMSVPVYKVLDISVLGITPVVGSLAATAISDSELNITFTSDADNFIVEKSQDNVSWSTLDINTVLSYSDTNLLDSTEYFYRVKARKAGQRDSIWAYTSGTTNGMP